MAPRIVPYSTGSQEWLSRGPGWAGIYCVDHAGLKHTGLHPFLFCLFFEAGFLCVVLAVLELTL